MINFPNLITTPNVCILQNFCPVEASWLQILTCLPYLFLGGYFLWNSKTNRTKFGKTFAVSLIATGLSAIYLHLYWNLLGQILDVFCIMFVCLLPEVFLLKVPGNFKWSLLLSILFGSIIVSLQNNFGLLFVYVFGLGSFPVIRHIQRKQFRKESLSLLIPLVVGICLWILGDNQGKWGLPLILPFHSAWHLLSVYVLYRLRMYYLSHFKI